MGRRVEFALDGPLPTRLVSRRNGNDVNRSLLSQRYVPLRKIAAGGMGEIYLARQTGVAGFQRSVVLKRIHRRLSDDPRAVEMFLAEARLASQLCHPNIVQIFDVGEEDGAYSIVMERVLGPSLRDLAESATRRGEMIPMELSLSIMAQVLEGLRYAHGFRDESGRPMRIVHRDISPTNILISYDGSVKIVDFGIAALESQIQETGIPPGKFAYMAPEALLGQPVDGRCDLFSVGVLLYELTVGQRLFRAASYEAMRRVVNDPIPPPTFARAGYPVDLEMLVMRGLERDPADRFASAEQMLEELENFAFDTGLRLSRLRLGRFTTRIMGLAGPPLEVVEREESEPGPASDPLQDDLDFDNRGLFDGGQLDAIPEGEQPGEAVAEEMEPDEVEEAGDEEDEEDEEGEEGETVEIRPMHQAQLRAHTVPPARMEGSALIVTDDLVEEVSELEQDDPRAEIRITPRTGSDVHEEITRRGKHPDPEPRPEPSEDLQRALQDISNDLQQAAASDRQRVQLIEELVGGEGADHTTDLVGEIIGHAVQPRPDAAAVGEPAASSAEAEAPRASDPPSPTTMDDELERVDRVGDRVMDDLELSDSAVTRLAEPEDEDSSILEPAEPPDHDVDLQFDDDDGLDDRTIELDGDDAAVEEVEPPPEPDPLDNPTLSKSGAPASRKKKRRRRVRRR